MRILFVSHHCYLDDSNGAAVASREMMQALARRGFGVEVLSGSMLDLREDHDPRAWIAERFEGQIRADDRALSLDARGVRVDAPDHLRLDVRGVPVTVHLHPTTRPRNPDEAEGREFLDLFEAIRGRCRPDAVVGYGGSWLAREVFRRARASGIATAFVLHNFQYPNPETFADVDRVCVPSRFAADYHGEALGIDCTVLPNLIDRERIMADQIEPRFVTFVNPSPEKGVWPFARIAEELGRRRPDIPLLVVEGRGNEETLAACGLDLRVHGNVFLMAHTADPRRFWSKTRVCLLPSLWWENQPLVAVEALSNGIPVIASDRGGLPETLGDAGIVLPLPDRLTPATRTLPTAEEVAPWVEAIVRLWDDPGLADEHRRRAREEAKRWDPEILEPQYVRFFSEIRPGPAPRSAMTTRRSRSVVLVPGSRLADQEAALGAMEDAGIRIIRLEGGGDPDQSRSILASEAILDGFESLLMLDPDLAFDPFDAMRLLARPEPVLVGVAVSEAADGTVAFANGVGRVRLGTVAPGLYPVERFGAGFLRVRAGALRRLIAEGELPRCSGRGHQFWPFFQPIVVIGDDGPAYLGAVEAFAHRLGAIGVTPLADTSVRLTRTGEASPWARMARSWDEVPGMFDFESLYDEAVERAQDGAVFVEVGCLVGRSTCYLGTRIRESGKAIMLYAVDTGRGSPTDSTGREIVPALGGSLAGALHRNLIGCGLEGVVVPILTDSVRASRLFPAEGVDFCFIDGDHGYRSVMADLDAWWPKVRPGGTLAGHDYRQSAPWMAGVTPAVHDFFEVREAAHALVPHCWAVSKRG